MNQIDGKYFDFWHNNNELINQIASYLKKEDLEWLGFNWFRLRVGFLILDDHR